MSYMDFASRSPSPASSDTSTTTCSLPRLLFLHGGGVNSAIFNAQCRAILPLLRPHFRIVYAEAPFFCDPHPDIVMVYGDYGPFRRWLRWKDEHTEMDAETIIDEVTYAIRTAMEDDERLGGRGEWVGLVGFSQGAKVAGSILLEQQIREAEVGYGKGVGACGITGVHWRFGVLMAARAPFVTLDPTRQCSKSLVEANEKCDWYDSLRMPPAEDEMKLRLPTAHIHGTKDEGLQLHRKLLRDCCVKGSTTLVEWGGTHRIPFKSVDVQAVVEAIFHVAREGGVDCGVL